MPTPPSSSFYGGTKIPTIKTHFSQLPNGRQCRSVTINGRTAHTLPNIPNVPNQPCATGTLNGGIIYAPYIPLVQTTTLTGVNSENTIEFPVNFSTDAIPDFAQRYPNGLLLSRLVYDQTLEQLNAELTHCVYDIFGTLDVLLTTAIWRPDPLYVTLWTCQSNGPLLLCAPDRIFFQARFLVRAKKNNTIAQTVDQLKQMYQHPDPQQSPLEIKLKGKLSIKRDTIVKIEPDHIEWWENGGQLL